MKGKTALICGGSKGIGKETAREILRRGGNVCLVARNREGLASAAAELASLVSDASRFVETIACDTSDAERLAPLLNDFVSRHGVPDYLINAVGFAYPQYVQELTLADHRNCMEVNYFGQLVPISILLPHFLAARQGHIANITSMMGYFGVMGYGAYAPTKFALVGLTEALRHELKPYNIHFSLLFPPDTDTPGFAQENRSKPPECALISEKAKLMHPHDVAKVFVAGMVAGEYLILPGEAKLIWRLNRWFPGLIRWMTDRMYRQARQKLGKTP